MCAKLVCHTVHKTKRGGIECYSCKTCRDVHLAARMRVVVISPGANEELTADLNRFLGKRARKLIVIGADVGLDGVGHDVHAGVSRDGGGHGFDQHLVQYCFFGHHVLGAERIFFTLGRVGNDGKRGDLATRTRGGGNGDESGSVVGLDLTCELANRLGGIDGRAAADRDHAGILSLEHLGHACDHLVNRGIGHNVGKQGIAHACAVQTLGDVLDQTRGHDKGVGKNDHAIKFDLRESVQCRFSEIYLCTDVEFFHRSLLGIMLRLHYST